MKVVLDTNVLISAFLWHGVPHSLLKLVEQRTLTLCLTPSMLEEIHNVLSRPTFISRIKRLRTSCEELLTGLLALAELHPDEEIESVVKDDPDDDKVLACAKASGAKYIVTGDPHLLILKSWSGISILTPRQFLSII